MRKAFALGLVGALGVLSGPSIHLASAQQQGETIVFLLPASGGQPELNHRLIYTSGRVTTTGAGDCAAGQQPVQNAVLIDPGGGRATRIIGIITIRGEAAAPGTRLDTLTLDANCSISGTAYNRYNGTVQWGVAPGAR